MGPGDLYLTTSRRYLDAGLLQTTLQNVWFGLQMNKPQFLTTGLEVQGGRHTMVILCDKHNNGSFRAVNGERFSVQGAVLTDVGQKRGGGRAFCRGQALQAPSHEET